MWQYRYKNTYGFHNKTGNFSQLKGYCVKYVFILWINCKLFTLNLSEIIIKHILVCCHKSTTAITFYFEFVSFWHNVGSLCKVSFHVLSVYDCIEWRIRRHLASSDFINSKRKNTIICSTGRIRKIFKTALMLPEILHFSTIFAVQKYFVSR